QVSGRTKAVTVDRVGLINLTSVRSNARVSPMLRPRNGLSTAMLAFGLLTVGCATKVQPAVAPAPTPQVVVAAPTAPAPQPPQPDPITELIALSNQHFEAGQHELQLGHLE